MILSVEARFSKAVDTTLIKMGAQGEPASALRRVALLHAPKIKRVKGVGDLDFDSLMCPYCVTAYPCQTLKSISPTGWSITERKVK